MLIETAVQHEYQPRLQFLAHKSFDHYILCARSIPTSVQYKTEAVRDLYGFPQKVQSCFEHYLLHTVRHISFYGSMCGTK